MSSTLEKSLLSLVAIAAICCGSISSDRISDQREIHADSLFKYCNIKSIRDKNVSRDYDSQKRQFNLISLSASDRKLLMQPIFRNNSFYNAYYYSKQNKIKNLAPILVLRMQMIIDR
jgi:hypothetical protein